MRRAEPVTEADLKPVKESAPSSEAAKAKAPKTETATAKTEKAAPKEKSPPVTDGATNKKVAKTEPAKENAGSKSEPAKPAESRPCCMADKAHRPLNHLCVGRSNPATSPT